MVTSCESNLGYRPVRLALLGVAVSLGLAACASQSTTLPTAEQEEAINEGVEAADASNQPTVTWDCDGQMIPVRFMDASVLVEFPDGVAVTLPQAISGSGVRYTDGTYLFWEHQGTARIETPTQTWEDCTQASA
ncbi:MAG: MliC family protein [Pseudomonadota bacterium]